MYSIADDKRLAISDVDSRRRVYQVKCSNFRPKCMVHHPEVERLYISMREAILFIFDVADIEPFVLHTIKVNHMIGALTLDQKANFLFALDKKGTLL